MAISIPAKWGSKVPEEPKPEGSLFDRRRSKLQAQEETDKYLGPHLGDLMPLFRHECTIFIAGQYVGKGYGNYREEFDLYDRIGQILSKV
ncbi:MAG: hypothetical protein MUE44_34690 [Oscillatoriaceae cyanobacterium Prado104]|jgi:hypothetical protein|nr:hypothetical protein [Oscillatoriaceae cyanobacterium Prado104]